MVAIKTCRNVEVSDGVRLAMGRPKPPLLTTR